MPPRRSRPDAPLGELGNQDGNKGKGGGCLPLGQGQGHLGQKQAHLSHLPLGQGHHVHLGQVLNQHRCTQENVLHAGISSATGLYTCQKSSWVLLACKSHVYFHNASKNITPAISSLPGGHRSRSRMCGTPKESCWFSLQLAHAGHSLIKSIICYAICKFFTWIFVFETTNWI